MSWNKVNGMHGRNAWSPDSWVGGYSRLYEDDSLEERRIKREKEN